MRYLNLLLIIFLFFMLVKSVAAFDIEAPNTVPQPVSTVAEADKSTQNVYNTVVYLFFTIGIIGSLVFTVWGAVEWITSGGDKDKLGSAKKKITTALIGLVVLSLAFMIVYMVGKIIGIDFVKLPPLQTLGNIK
jgi:quinol-cytochrome oxidoreductase complex cytochrome b subunit